MPDRIHNPSVIYPFVDTGELSQQQVAVASAIKDMRLCLYSHAPYLKEKSNIKVLLTQASSTQLNFSVQGIFTQPVDIIYNYSEFKSKTHYLLLNKDMGSDSIVNFVFPEEEDEIVDGTKDLIYSVYAVQAVDPEFTGTFSGPPPPQTTFERKMLVGGKLFWAMAAEYPSCKQIYQSDSWIFDRQRDKISSYVLCRHLAEGSYLQLSGTDMPTMYDCNLQLLTQNIVLIQAGPQYQLFWNDEPSIHAKIKGFNRHIHPKGGLWPQSGYNCNVQYDQDTGLHMYVGQGAGLGVAEGYKHWIQFASDSQSESSSQPDNQPESDSTQQSNSSGGGGPTTIVLPPGVRAINGITGSVSFSNGLSLTLTQTIGTNSKGQPEISLEYAVAQEGQG